MLDPKSFHIVVDSFDGVSNKIHIHARVIFKKDNLSWSKDTETLFKNSQAVQKGKVIFGPFSTDDLTEKFDVLGLQAAQRATPQQAPMPGSHCSEAVPS